MTPFGALADELTEAIEGIENSSHAADATALCRALQQAFKRACELDRTLRKRAEAELQLSPDAHVRAAA